MRDLNFERFLTYTRMRTGHWYINTNGRFRFRLTSKNVPAFTLKSQNRVCIIPYYQTSTSMFLFRFSIFNVLIKKLDKNCFGLGGICQNITATSKQTYCTWKSILGGITFN